MSASPCPRACKDGRQISRRGRKCEAACPIPGWTMRSRSASASASCAALDRFSIYSRAASRAAEDPDCRDLMDAAYRYALDLFSATAHEKWAVGGTSGADGLRLKILGMLNAFR